MKINDVLQEIEGRLECRWPDGTPINYVMITRAEAEALLQLPKQLSAALDDGVKDFLDVVAKAVR
jgi:hypothetical protein